MGSEIPEVPEAGEGGDGREWAELFGVKACVCDEFI